MIVLDTQHGRAKLDGVLGMVPREAVVCIEVVGRKRDRLLLTVSKRHVPGGLEGGELLQGRYGGGSWNAKLQCPVRSLVERMFIVHIARQAGAEIIDQARVEDVGLGDTNDGLGIMKNGSP